LAEVEQALSDGVELIDLKDPSPGALGALTSSQVSTAVALVGGRRRGSATVGDLPPDVRMIAAAARAAAATGVDIVKLGFFPCADHRALAMDLAPLASSGIRMVAVLMADQKPDLGIVSSLAEAGFVGVMLDTADKHSGSLLQHLCVPALTAFLATARGQGLATGLAGSLRLDDVATLVPLRPDFLGFRRALCSHGRTSVLDEARLSELRREIDELKRLGSEGKACHSRPMANIVAN
jgi:uncharacterized protein (UPF0264 family)